MAHESNLKLPLSIVSPSDLKRLKRELENIDDALLQMEIREGGEDQVKLPKTSAKLDELVALNKLNLLHKNDRENLNNLLSLLVDKAPVLHLSFSSDPSPEFMIKLTRYLRDSFGPYVLVIIGLAPSLGAGCIARTTNHVFDLSLKQALLAHKDILHEEIAASLKPSPKVSPSGGSLT